MKSKNNTNKRINLKVRVFIAIIVLVVLFTASFVFYKLLNVRETILKETPVKTLQENPTCAISLGENLLIGNAQGYIALVTPEGSVKFSKKLDNKIFGFVYNDSDNSLIVAGASFHYLDKDFNEKFKLSFENYIPRDPYAKVLSDGSIVFVFQSLKDLSYLIVKTDKTFKVVAKNSIPDMGQNSSIAITSSGKIAFGLEGGDIYLLDGDKIVTKQSLIDSSTSSINNVFVLAYPKDGIIGGYKNLIKDPNLKNSVSIPVSFFNNSLTLSKKVIIDSTINNISIYQNKAVFATDSGFYFYDSQGNLLNSLPKVDNIPYAYFENSQNQLFVYRVVNSQSATYYQLILKESNGKEVGRFMRVFKVDNPIFVLSKNSNKVYIIEGTQISIVQK